MNEDTPNYRCSDCAHLKRGFNPSCPCFDHSKVEHYAPWFKSSREEVGFPCRMFEPSAIHVWDLEHYWTDYETWFKDYIDLWKNGRDFREYTLPWFTIKGDDKNAYAISWEDYLSGNVITDGKLNAIKKRYVKQSRSSPTGYELVVEECEQVEV